MKEVVEFSLTPANSEHNLDIYRPESEEDGTLFKLGESLLQKYCRGQPVKIEGWDMRPSWGDAKAYLPMVWLRILSNKNLTWKRVPGDIILSKAYKLNQQTQNAENCTGTYFVRLDTFGATSYDAFESKHVREKGINWIRKRAEEILGSP